MSARIIDGKKIAEEILLGLSQRLAVRGTKLVILQVGERPESSAYIRQKQKACEKVGIASSLRRFPPTVSFEELVSAIHDLNADASVTGYILQLPLPEELQSRIPELVAEIDPRKDVDGFHAYNLGKVFLSKEFEHLPPATPAGVVLLLEHERIPIEGKEVVVVGRSNTVGKPLAVMLVNRGATVTVCHSRTKNLASHTKRADILIAAVGKPKCITADMVKRGAVVIDVGITQTAGGFSGDVDFDLVKEVASAITPVPGGVGPMTVASLLRNVVRARERQMG